MIPEKADILSLVRLRTLQVHLEWGGWSPAKAPPSPVLAVTVLDSMYLGQRPQPLWAILYWGDSSVRCSMMSGIPASAYPMSVAVPLPPPLHHNIQPKMPPDNVHGAQGSKVTVS